MINPVFLKPNTVFLNGCFCVFLLVLTGCQRHQTLNKPETLSETTRGPTPSPVVPSTPQQERQAPPTYEAKMPSSTAIGRPANGMALLRITVAEASGAPVRATIAFERGITYGYRLFRQIPPGVYRVEAMAVGYKPKYMTITLLAGQVLNQTLLLEKDR
ncbi:MAG TPA: carboxypeptidase-like regulatory domain-containing protein [Rhodothermales bacterium]|nr:carboxypeptidase-like regulatory domain-containing protein [Rhodothermales bacterium]